MKPAVVSSYYSNSKISLNTYRSSSEPGNKNDRNIPSTSVNNRTFEIAACQTMQLSEHKEEIARHFPLGEKLTFRSTIELTEKLSIYLENEDERTQMAASCYQTTVNKHTFTERIQQIMKTISS